MAKRRFTSFELERAASDPQALAALVEESAGYALVKMREQGLGPSWDAVFECLSAESVGFVLDHCELDEPRRDQVAAFMRKRHAHTRLAGAMSESEVEQALRAGRALPESVALTKGQMDGMGAEEVERQIEMDAAGWDELVSRSAKAMGAAEFAKLGRPFLRRHAWVFGELGALGDEGLRALAKELVLERCAERGRAPRLSDFSFWRFAKGDEGLLWSLIEVEDREFVSWNSLGEVDGARDLIDPWEFHVRTGRRRARQLPEDVFDAKLGELREALAAPLLSGPPAPRELGKLLAFDCGIEQFEKLFDPELARRVVERLGGIDFGSIYRDDEESKAKVSALKISALKAGLADWEGFGCRLSSKEWAELVEEALRRGLDFGASEEDEAFASGALEQALGRCLRGPKAAETVMEAGSHWLGADSIPWIEGYARAHPSPNLLMMCARELAKSDRRPKRLASLVEFLAGSVELPWARKICEAAGLGPVPEGPIRVRSAPGENLLEIDYRSAEALGDPLLRALAAFDPGFADGARAARLLPCEKALARMLGEGTPGALAALRAAADVAGGPEGLEASRPSFFAAALSHPWGEAILGPEAARSKEERAVFGAMALAAESVELWRAIEIGRSKRGSDPKGAREEAGTSKALAELEAKSWELSRSLAKELSSASHARVGAELAAALARGDYGTFRALSGAARGQDSEEMFARRAKAMELGEFVGLLESDPDFRQVAAGSVGYGGKTKMRLDFGSARANRKAAEALGKAFEDPVDALFAFELEACREFAGDMAIDLWPARAVYDYRLRPGLDASGPFSKPRVAPYDSGQLLRLWRALGGCAGWFCSRGANDRPHDMLRDNFEGRPAEFHAFVQESKSEPLLHALLAGADLSHVLRDGETQQDLRTDVARMRHLAKHFDWGVLLEGLGELFDAMGSREGDARFNHDLAKEAFDRIVWRTYWDCQGASGETLFRSELGRAESEALAALVLEKAPALVHTVRAIGSLGPMGDYWESSIGSLLGEDGLDRVFFPSAAHAGGGSEPLSGRSGEVSAKAMRGALEWMVAGGRDEDLLYLDWAIKQRQFIESEIDGRKKPGCEWPAEAGARPWLGPLDLLAEREDLLQVLRAGLERLGLDRACGDTKSRRAKAMRL